MGGQQEKKENNPVNTWRGLGNEANRQGFSLLAA